MGEQRTERKGPSMARRRRPPGRPPKFGRPSQLVALTLPEDVLTSLRTLHNDVARAIVQLVESMGNARRVRAVPSAIAELVQLSGKGGLIVVQPKPFARLPGVATIPLGNGRAFLAFDRAVGLADLEVAILDKLESSASGTIERRRLTEVLQAVRGWRRDRRLVFRTKTILVAESRAHAAHMSPGRKSQ